MSDSSSVDSSSRLSVVRPLSPIEAAIMVFCAFDGLLLLVWSVMVWFDYPADWDGRKIVWFFTFASTPFFLLVIGRRFKEKWFRCVPGLSWPILLFLLIPYIRFCVENWHVGKRPVIGAFLALSFPIIVAAFSVPLDKKSGRTAFYVLFLSLIGMAALMLGNWYDWILDGVTIRRGDFFSMEQKIIRGVWGTMDGTVIFAVAHAGAVLGLLALAGWVSRKIHWTICLATYTLGSTLVYFSSCRSVILAWCLCNIIVFLTFGFLKRKSSLLLIPAILLINAVLLLQIGKNDQHHISSRFARMGKSMNKIINDSRKSLHQLFPALVADATLKTVPVKPEARKPETPKTETPKTETPKTETPKTETPKTETPKTETPKTETPKTETPKTETPKTETPKTETPKTETPKTETPKTETPKTRPVIEEMVVAKPKAPYVLVHDPITVRKIAVPATSIQYAQLRAYEQVDIRILLQRVAMTLVLENPFFGYGFNIVAKIDDHYFTFSPHSNIMTILLATGFVGGGLFVVVFIMGMYDSYIVCRYHSDFSWLVVLWIYAFTANFFDTKIISYPLFWLPLVALHAVVVTYRSERIVSRPVEPAALPENDA